MNNENIILATLKNIVDTNKEHRDNMKDSLSEIIEQQRMIRDEIKSLFEVDIKHMNLINNLQKDTKDTETMLNKKIDKIESNCIYQKKKPEIDDIILSYYNRRKTKYNLAYRIKERLILGMIISAIVLFFLHWQNVMDAIQNLFR